ncbi:MAG TPA: alpha/beta fold hydrolase [Candidatus Nanopelagicales bacterium]|nr:alpha/beta fold hydrolase [Candidatus Nanopelagicales bacterium]
MTDLLDGDLPVRRQAPEGFRPDLATALREQLSMLRVGAALARRRRVTPVPPDPSRLPVVLVPGFLAGDFAMRPMSDALRAAGHWTGRSGIAPNVGCTLTLAAALTERVAQVAQDRGSPVALVGWSRGGTIGKLVALRRPDLVASLITLATPNLDPLAVNATLARELALLTRLRALGVPGLLGEDCIAGDCAAQVRDELAVDLPADLPYLSVFSTSDGVVDWRACLDPAAEHQEVDATHMAMGAEPAVIELVVGRLAPAAALLDRITAADAFGERRRGHRSARHPERA